MLGTNVDEVDSEIGTSVSSGNKTACRVVAIVDLGYLNFEKVPG